MTRIREVAEQVARESVDDEYLVSCAALVDRIETALLAERERCAQIAETKFAPTDYGRWDVGYVNAGLIIATAIREEGA